MIFASFIKSTLIGLAKGANGNEKETFICCLMYIDCRIYDYDILQLKSPIRPTFAYKKLTQRSRSSGSIVIQWRWKHRHG